MRVQRRLTIILVIVFFLPITSISAGDSATQTGDLILRNGPWHVGDEIEFSILVHNGGSDTISSFLEIEIQGDYSNGSSIQIEPGNSVELKSTYVGQGSGIFAVNWTVNEVSENVTETFSGITEVMISEQQLLFAEVYSVDYDYENGYSINWGANLSNGKSRLIDAGIYFVTNEDYVLASQMDLILEPGLRTSNTMLGIAPDSTYKIEVILTPIDWTTSTVPSSSQDIESEISGLTIGIVSGPTPESPTIGDVVKMAVNIGNNGDVDVGSGIIVVADGQKRMLGEFNAPSVKSGSSQTIELTLNEWMSTSTTTLELIWIMDDYITKTNIEIVSSNTDEIVEGSNISVNWMSVIIGIGLALSVVFGVRIISVKNQTEHKETKTYSTRTQKVDEKEETEKRSINCPSCSKLLQVPENYSGQVKCPSCLTQFSAKVDANNEEDLTEELTASSEDDVIGCPKCDQVLRVPYDKRPAKARCPACKCIFNALAI
ncbi:MAG: hypothetical protein VX613_05945 [Candidatus Thermoplasmatota archaeon]|nr:hypothetical protein [Candidatus Thermoplasmatota archaeon]